LGSTDKLRPKPTRSAHDSHASHSSQRPRLPKKYLPQNDEATGFQPLAAGTTPGYRRIFAEIRRNIPPIPPEYSVRPLCSLRSAPYSTAKDFVSKKERKTSAISTNFKVPTQKARHFNGVPPVTVCYTLLHQNFSRFPALSALSPFPRALPPMRRYNYEYNDDTFSQPR
jgi:hypothetical protein